MFQFPKGQKFADIMVPQLCPRLATLHLTGKLVSQTDGYTNGHLRHGGRSGEFNKRYKFHSNV